MIALDTNILIYSVEKGEKSPIAASVVLRAAVLGAVLPLQVIAEFANACRRKAVLDMARVQARIEEFMAGFHVVQTSPQHVVAAVALAQRYALSYFDALICTVAAGSGATTLLSEDMQDGMQIDGLTIVNPFNDSNRSMLDELLGVVP